MYFQIHFNQSTRVRIQFQVQRLFGFAHYLSPIYTICADLIGLYLVIYHISGNLYIVMAIHALCDFVALMYLVKKGRGEKTGLQTVG
ncbi:MAG: CPBP family intramembrane metalloprotease [Anaerolineales bacterium]|nr:CPBP family intramembrane metalloprotease [Anaerolineales bacterium]